LDDNLFRLPVSGRVVSVSPLNGKDDLLLVESASGDTVLAMTLANRLARDLQGADLDWGSMAVTDLDAFIVFLRRMLIGDRIRADTACRAAGCGKRIDIEFGVGQFLNHHAPSPLAKSCRGWSVQPTQESGWYRLAPRATNGASVVETIDFRLPTPNDQLAVHGLPNAVGALMRRCLSPADAPASLRRKAEAALEAIAPCLSCDLQAVCPECGTQLNLYFEPRRFCLSELRDRAASIYADVDVLARCYHWSENEILSLPRARRVAYVQLAQAQSN
jgi:hypothetical protein